MHICFSHVKPEYFVLGVLVPTTYFGLMEELWELLSRYIMVILSLIHFDYCCQ